MKIGAAAAPVVPARNTCPILEHPAASGTGRHGPPSRMAASRRAPARPLQSVPACRWHDQRIQQASDRQVERDM